MNYLSHSTMLNDKFGYAMTYRTSSGEYGARIAKVLLVVLKELNISGICEYYAGSNPWLDDYYRVGIGFKHVHPVGDIHGHYLNFLDVVDLKLRNSCNEILLRDYCELTYISSIRANFLLRGHITLDDGRPTKILNDVDSFFLAEVRNALTNQ
ncbi:MAG: hypothetical protein PHU23_11915 [Dehalococcoidales bacterium]|nr:hypothetical protein [Dehalococcoidales bacterium]